MTLHSWVSGFVYLKEHIAVIFKDEVVQVGYLNLECEGHVFL